MAEVTGANFYVTFKGTNIYADYREAKQSEKVGLVDASAGADAAETYLKTLLSGDFSLKTLWQNTAAGDAVYLLCAPGAEGSLVIGPIGPTAANVKITVNAIVESCEPSYPYKDVIELDTKFRFSGSPSRGTF